MNKLYLILVVLLIVAMAGCVQSGTDLGAKSPDESSPTSEFCGKQGTAYNMSFGEARGIAEGSTCVNENSSLTDEHWCNNVTGTWWIDLSLEKPGCNPACVINVETREAEINWMCTGLLS